MRRATREAYGRELPEATDTRLRKAVMPAGSALVWLGNLFHRGGANDSERTPVRFKTKP